MQKLRSQATLSISMTSFSNDRVVRAVSRLVSEFCHLVALDEDVPSRFHMAAQELAENLVKYSTGPKVSLEVELEENDEGTRLMVRACNESTPERLREVEQRLLEITTAKDPAALYDRLIRESAPRRDFSGLGLARLRAEGDLEVGYTITGNALTISVHTPVIPRKNT